VLVVEDHDFQRRTALALLRRLGVAELHEASDGRAALEVLGDVASPPDVIICDIDMPGMDGVEFIRHVARRGLASAIAIASGLDRRLLETVHAVGEGYGLQVLGAVEKPLTVRALSELLEAYRPAHPGGGRGDELQLSADEIEHGLSNDRIAAELEPIADLASGRIGAAELIPSWREKFGGRTSRASFAAAAEVPATAELLAERLVELAGAAARELAAGGLAEFQLAVRLAHPALLDASLADRLADVAVGGGVVPSQMALILRTRMLAGGNAIALDVLARLRLKGFGLWLDEAGPEAQLERMPLTGIRLAPSLVAAAAADAAGATALQATVDRARRRACLAIGTGCAGAEEFGLLLDVGASHAQSDFVGPARPAEELLARARTWTPPVLAPEGSSMNARATGARRTLPSFRRLLAILLGVLGLLVGGLLVVASLQVSGSAAQTRAENRRISSFLLADSLRQSSNDLTNMVRLYVATGDPRYRNYYTQILAIRAGTSARPQGYDSSFWDRVLARGEGFVRYGAPESLISQMRAARFASDEFDALQGALAASDNLAQLERSVMARTAQIIRRSGVGSGYSARVALVYHRLVDHNYLVQKGMIMGAVQRFVGLVNARTLRDVQQAQAHNRHLVSIEIAILVLIVLVGLAAMALLTRVVLRPLDRLTAATRRIAGGDYTERVDVHAVSELERVANAFNAMADAVETDVAARERAEREALAAKGWPSTRAEPRRRS
jgi:EAL domain-containing protein (putative c-di-GMP-specific phosphodiesterase class I)/HAMP domain-containing protein